MHPPAVTSRIWLRVFVCVILLTGFAASAPARARENFQPLAAFARTDGALSLTVSADGREVVLGDARGAVSSRDGGVPVGILRGVAVNDLAFDARGRLWLATDDGLFERANGALLDRGPGPGAARRVRRVVLLEQRAGLPRSALAASAGGLLRWREGLLPARIGRAPSGEAQALAWLPRVRGGVLAALVDGRLFELLFDARGQVRSVKRARVSDRLGALLDLSSAAGRLFVLGERGVAERATSGWRAGPLGLPPGARPSRFVVQGARFWVATPGGLLTAARGDAHFTRAAWRARARRSGGAARGRGRAVGRRRARCVDVARRACRRRARVAVAGECCNAEHTVGAQCSDGGRALAVEHSDGTRAFVAKYFDDGARVFAAKCFDDRARLLRREMFRRRHPRLRRKMFRWRARIRRGGF